MIALSKILASLNRCADLLTNPKPICQVSTVKKHLIASADLAANTNVLLAASNPNRKGWCAYNNSTSSGYLMTDVNAGTGNQIAQLASNAGPTAHYEQMGTVIYTGPIYIRRNAGAAAGSAWLIEFE